MRSTLELLDRAIKQLGVSERQLSIRLGYKPTTLTTARHRKNLSPVVTFQLCDLLGEDSASTARWMALASVEPLPSSGPVDEIRRALQRIA